MIIFTCRQSVKEINAKSVNSNTLRRGDSPLIKDDSKTLEIVKKKGTQEINLKTEKQRNLSTFHISLVLDSYISKLDYL